MSARTAVKPWREFNPAPRPKGMRQMKAGACHSNAARVVFGGRFPGLAYVEGLASPDFAPTVPVWHSWLVDDEGNAYNPTWPRPGVRYIGRTFKPEDVAKAMCAQHEAGQGWGAILDPLEIQALVDYINAGDAS